jgi:hypothetical protein
MVCHSAVYQGWSLRFASGSLPGVLGAAAFAGNCTW